MSSVGGYISAIKHIPYNMYAIGMMRAKEEKQHLVDGLAAAG
jgi:hypothetical protein